MKKLIFLGACLWALGSTPVMAQTGGPQVIVVRINTLHLAIIYPDGKSEVIPVEGPGLTEKKLVESGVTYQRVITKLVQDGYALKSTFSGVSGTVSTLVFVKGQ
ncbi:hypothetical protein GCM10027422_28790 [Hymenobacter arcticus]